MFVFTPRAFAVLFVLGERAPTEKPEIRLVDVFFPLSSRAAGGVGQELTPAAEISSQITPCVCGVSFNSKLVWNIHKKSDHKCTECSTVLAGVDGFKRHLKRSHSLMGLYQCFCGRGFTSQAAIGSHMRRLHKCGVCSYIVPTAAVFQEHVAAQHRLEGDNVVQVGVEVEEELSEPSCDVCGFVSGAKSEAKRKFVLKRHHESCQSSTETSRMSVVKTATCLDEEDKTGGDHDEKEASQDMEQEEVGEGEYDGDEEGGESGPPSWMIVLCKKPGITVMSSTVRPPGN